MKPTASAAERKSTTGLKSMTGYAQARVERDGWLLRVNVRSLNHRFLDVHLRLPEGFESFEPQIRQLARERLRRGHVEITLRVETVQGPAVRVNREIAGAYLHAATELRREFALSPDADLVPLLRLPGVVTAAGAAGGPLAEEDLERLGAQVKACAEEALDRLEEMRRAEGRSLADEMRRLVASIGATTAEVEALAERSRPLYAQRLKSRIEELLGGAPMDAARLAQEAALLAERADVSEELARLRSHVDQFDKLMSGSVEIGKKLDFLLQEMQREANTLLSKTPGLGQDGLAITDRGLHIKAEIERLKEQVQNVE
jgi:uncharacterized protein (TIGR00255 family)